MTDPGIYVRTFEQQDPRLGRTVVHDERSRGFVAPRGEVDRSTWRDISIPIWDPIPNPNQCHGECTTCAECMMLNSRGNRVKGRILDIIDNAHPMYSFATSNDPFPGAWTPPTWEDTGSSGLAAAKASVYYGYAEGYDWEFGGIEGVLQNIHEGRVMSLGTVWDWNMFNPDPDGIIHPGGGQAGGHQYVARGHLVKRRLVKIRCWWGSGFRDVLMHEEDLGEKLADDGDAHHTRSVRV